MTIFDEMSSMYTALIATDDALRDDMERRTMDHERALATLEDRVAALYAAQNDQLARIEALEAPVVTRPTMLLREAAYEATIVFSPHDITPVPEVRAPSSGTTSYVDSHPEVGTADGAEAIVDAARLAYAHYLNGAYDAAFQIVKDWAATCQSILFDQPRRVDNKSQVWANGLLVSAWAGSLFARVLHGLSFDHDYDVLVEAEWLHRVFLPNVESGWSNASNWIMSANLASLEIAALHENTALWDAQIAYFEEKLPACWHLSSEDGPVPPPQAHWWKTTDDIKKGWRNPPAFVDGLGQESYVDYSHHQMGFTAAGQIVELSDSWDVHHDRMHAVSERHAEELNAYLDGDSTKLVSGLGGDSWKVGWNLFAKRLTNAPETVRLAERLNPDDWSFHNSWSSAVWK